MPRYLTKSRFKLGLNCPKKLYYTGKPQYPDSRSANSFLKALAEGGYQVGTLAKCYYPNGVDIEELGYEVPLERTRNLLTNQDVVIFEAAFAYQNLFIRADIVEKKGNTINLIEVKAKSFSGNSSLDFLNKKGHIIPSWKEYLYDIAFQKYVVTKAYPNFKIHSYLMLANKNAVATVNGLNQKFRLRNANNDRIEVDIVGSTTAEELGDEILIRVNVDDIVKSIFDGVDSAEKIEEGFINYIHSLANKYEQDEAIYAPINKNCKDCEFTTTLEQEREGKISGFKECWKSQLGWIDEDFLKPRILDIWDFRSKDELMQKGKLLMSEVCENEIGTIVPQADGTLSRTERQWLQVKKTVESDTEPYINAEGLKEELSSFKFPLHFIDFETSAVAIPFFKGRKPYEQIAFQFSHHIVYEDLSIEHKGQFLCHESGIFPNFEFIRQLKLQLENDKGTVFRYADHENTILNHILAQLNTISSAEVVDKDSLISFIKTITHSENHKGERDMVDLRKLVLKHYYHPLMGGSNSIKDVLPAILSSSKYIQEKYSEPIYGKNSLVKSLNYDDGWRWIQWNGEKIISPYKLLPPLFEGIDDEQIESFLMQSDIQDGGAAMTAYAKLQFTDVSELERELVVKGLLKYCELDTMAMVIIWEYWNSIIKS